jgi:ribosome-binding protein aMBF1 (putative translation factor)
MIRKIDINSHKNLSKMVSTQTNKPYNSPELDAFLALEDTIGTDHIRISMMLAAQIEDAMIAQNIGKKMLADKLCKKPSVITKWLSGTHNFEIKTLSQIANALNIELFAFEVVSEKETPIITFHPITLSVNTKSTVDMPQYNPNSVHQIYYNHKTLSSY